MNAHTNVRYSVYPRWSAGSPGQVNRTTAERVARDEKLAHDYALKGLYGPEARRKAQKDSLGAIVEEVWEVRGKLHYRDLITGETGEKRNRNRGH